MTHGVKQNDKNLASQSRASDTLGQAHSTS